MAQEAAAKAGVWRRRDEEFPEARLIGAHLVNALLRNTDYKNGGCGETA